MKKIKWILVIVLILQMLAISACGQNKSVEFAEKMTEMSENNADSAENIEDMKEKNTDSAENIEDMKEERTDDISQLEKDGQTISTSEETIVKDSMKDSAKNTVSAQCYVHICGEVKNPGVYMLKSGTRIFEVIALAGGLTEAAYGDYINQSLEVSDGQKIFIPSKQDVESGELTKRLEEIYGLEGTNNKQGTNHKQETNNQEGTNNKVTGAGAAVNINTASISELCTLNGIGESRAESIIAYRETNGEFQTIEEIKNVVGIKDAMFQKIKDNITVG